MTEPACLGVGAALAFVRKHGVVLVAAHGDAPRLVEAIAGEAIAGSWWAHARSRAIHAVLEGVLDSGEVVSCRLIDNKVTLVHRRLWPAMVRLADRLGVERCAQVLQEHTASGRHVNRRIAFPDWVTPELARQAEALPEQDARRAFARWMPHAG